MSSSAPSASSGSSESRSKAASEWQSRIKLAQISKDPKMMEQMLEAAEKQRVASIARQRCETLSRTNYVQTCSNVRTMTDFSAMSMRVEEEVIGSGGGVGMGGRRGGASIPSPQLQQQEYNTIREGSSARAHVLDRVVNSLSLAPPSAPPAVSMKAKKVFSRAEPTPNAASTTSVFSLRSAVREEDESEDDEAVDEAEQQLRSVEAELGINYNATVSANVHAQQRMMSNVMASNMHHLESEPTDPAEAAAKFALFESASQTVTTIREQTLKFWEENKASFPGKSGQECVRDIAKIDSQESMGIQDNPQVWFIYGMTKKCNENSTMINDLLAKFRQRLDLLLQELGDCPFCLLTLTHESACALGCCHRVCSDCWDNWVELKGNQAFCPLCRHREFIDEIANA